ncbi:MAG: hypothetical protein H6727_17855 [Myxococcales bacterium]|nr:hypothetical protein [Myxococcales bacterium]
MKPQGPVEIRKYSNRRLYNTRESHYITLQDVAEMIKAGIDLQVLDAKTGEDLTRAVMLQIICENKAQQEALPISFLRQVIQAGDKAVRSSIRSYLSMGWQAQREVQRQIGHWARAAMMMNPLIAPFLMGQRDYSRTPHHPDQDLAPIPTPPLPQLTAGNSDESPWEEIERLRLQLAAMQAQLVALQQSNEESI